MQPPLCPQYLHLRLQKITHLQGMCYDCSLEIFLHEFVAHVFVVNFVLSKPAVMFIQFFNVFFVTVTTLYIYLAPNIRYFLFAPNTKVHQKFFGVRP